ncbi:hypothetical protein ACQRI3_003023 [Morganella morganii]
MTKILRYLTVLTTLLLFVLPAQATLYSYITRSEGKPADIDYYYRITAWTPPPAGSVHPCVKVGLTKNATPILITATQTQTGVGYPPVITANLRGAAGI